MHRVGLAGNGEAGPGRRSMSVLVPARLNTADEGPREACETKDPAGEREESLQSLIITITTL